MIYSCMCIFAFMFVLMFSFVFVLFFFVFLFPLFLLLLFSWTLTPTAWAFVSRSFHSFVTGCHSCSRGLSCTIVAFVFLTTLAITSCISSFALFVLVYWKELNSSHAVFNSVVYWPSILLQVGAAVIVRHRHCLQFQVFFYVNNERYVDSQCLWIKTLLNVRRASRFLCPNLR